MKSTIHKECGLHDQRENSLDAFGTETNRTRPGRTAFSRANRTFARQVYKHCPARDQKAYGQGPVGRFWPAIQLLPASKKCDHRNLCDLNPACSRKCSLCKLCCSVCPDFEEERCTLLDSSPHVCNGCKQRRFCTLEKSLYKALDAQDEYEDLLHVARLDHQRKRLLACIDAGAYFFIRHSAVLISEIAQDLFPVCCNCVHRLLPPSMIMCF